RARRKLVDRREHGLVILDLDWVTPNHEYQLIWELPSQEHVFDKHEGVAVARSYIQELAALEAKDMHTFQKALSEIRDNCLKLIAEKSGTSAIAKFMQPEKETLSLWGYDRERHDIRVIVATFEPDNPFWSASLQYGAGVRGKAMRRGVPEF